MYTGLIARRYAQALLDFASSKGEEDAVYSQVRELVEHFAANPSQKKELASPVLTQRIKLSLLHNGIKGEVCSSLQGFFQLVARHGREKFLIFMLQSFIGLYERVHGITSVMLTTAAPLGDEIEGKVSSLVQKRTGCGKVRIESGVDESLIGGFVLRIDDMQMDASVATQLKELRSMLAGKL